MILSPGPGHPSDPADFAVRAAVLQAGGVHVFGVCLGMQGMVVAATSEDGVVTGVRHRTLPQEGVQFHPESVLSEQGVRLTRNVLGTG